jgi:SAM-dependent methyltransferase
LFLLGQKLVGIAQQALPEESSLRRLTPAARLVLADLTQRITSTPDAVAGRTGLAEEQVSALASQLADDGLVLVSADADGRQRLTVDPRRNLRAAREAPIDQALGAALGTQDPAVVREIAAMLDTVAERLKAGPAMAQPGGFDAAYKGTPAWEIGRPQPALAELFDAGAIKGAVLDVGCGTGEHALLAASLGHAATGVDMSPRAIEIARGKAAERGLPVGFEVGDALDLGGLAKRPNGGRFDTVIDSALFHVFSDEERARYAASLREVVPPGGRYFMICFSDRHPGGFGPRRVSQQEIRSTFADGWRVDAIDPVRLEITLNPEGVQAWRASLTRV